MKDLSYPPPGTDKGMFDHPRHATGSVGRARRLRREMTSAERLLWRELRKLDMHFRRQAPIGRYVADFAHHPARVVVEIDGYYHEHSDRQLRDAARTDWLKSQGYVVLRFSDADIFNRIEEVVAEILAPFPLDGGRVGDGGARAVAAGLALEAVSEPSVPPHAPATDLSRQAPPSPPLPPSRGKGGL